MLIYVYKMYIYLYSRPLWLIALLIVIGIALWSWLSYMLSTKSPAAHHTWTFINGVLFVLSLCAILFITLLRRDADIQVTILRPFQALLAAREEPEVWRELLMNTFLFVPFGLALSQLLPRKWAISRRVLLVVLLGIAVSITVEWAQYHFALGTAETDDVICNTLGAFLGALPILITAKTQR